MPAKIIVREFTGDLASLRSRSQRIVAALDQLNTTHIVGVPDNATKVIYDLGHEHEHIRVVPVCREGEAWAVASGLWVGGCRPVVVIQNTGFLESGDAFRGTALAMGVPLLALMDYRGYHTLAGPADGVDSAARLFEPTLRAWELPYHFLTPGEEGVVIHQAATQAQHLQQPVALLMT